MRSQLEIRKVTAYNRQVVIDDIYILPGVLQWDKFTTSSDTNSFRICVTTNDHYMIVD